MHILDTDALSLLQRGTSPESKRLESRLATAGVTIRVTIITVEEQVRGRLAQVGAARTIAELSYAYGRLSGLFQSARNWNIVDFDNGAAAEFDRLKRSRIRIGVMDLRIAAICIANGAKLITRNKSDFDQVPGLTAEDWTK